jgi:Tol biopolymer transport system component
MGFTRDGAFYYYTQTPMHDVYTADVDLKAGKILGRPKAVSEGSVGINCSPAWSPDGRYVAYVAQRDPRSEQRIICIQSLETGEERDVDAGLRIGPFRTLRWFPDGRAVAVGGVHKDEKARTVNLYRVDVQTGEAQVIVRGRTLGLAIAPDGKTIFYTRVEKGGFKRPLIRRELHSGQEQELYRFSGHYLLALSRDGQHLAFNEGNSLKTIPTAGGQPREIVELPEGKGRLLAIEWAADGEYLLFAKEVKNSKPQLWKVSVEDGQSQNLGSAPGLTHLRLHPDGRRITFATKRTKRDLWVMENFLPEPEAAD